MKALKTFSTLAILSVGAYLGGETAKKEFLSERLNFARALRVEKTGSAQKVDGSTYQLTIPITYKVSVCSVFTNFYALDYVNTEIPHDTNLEQRAFVVRAFFKQPQQVMTASILPLNHPCATKVEKTELLSFRIHGDEDIPYVATSLSVPMEGSESKTDKFLVVLNQENGQVSVQPFTEDAISKLGN